MSDDTFSATADVALRGRHCCKLVLCRTGITTEEGFDILKRRCIAWIEQAECARNSDHTTLA